MQPHRQTELASADVSRLLRRVRSPGQRPGQAQHRADEVFRRAGHVPHPAGAAARATQPRVAGRAGPDRAEIAELEADWRHRSGAGMSLDEQTQNRTRPRRVGFCVCSPVPRGAMAIDPSNILLTDRVAVVTGAGSGIGRGIAAGMAAFGAPVAIWERDPQTCAAAAESIGGLGITTDVRDSGSSRRRTETHHRRIGDGDDPGQQCRWRVFLSAIGNQRKRLGCTCISANLRHVLLCTQRIARQLVTAGLPGSIISLTSIEGVRAAPGYAAYAAAKAGVINYTKTRGTRTRAARNTRQRDSARHHADRRAGRSQRR